MYRQSLAEFEKKGKFPMSDVLDLLLSHDIELRKAAYATLKDLYKVDFGFSEVHRDMSHWDQSTAWRDPWVKWAIKEFGQHLEQIDWPRAH
jgi:hypothetical protein